MANIKKTIGKKGISYQITVSHGRDVNGKQIRHYKTYVPSINMSENKIKKELDRIALEFENEIKNGYLLDNKQKFFDYANYVIELKERNGIKHKTIERYKDLLLKNYWNTVDL